jgi:flagellar biosynthesis chaperone FliJ
MKAAGFDGFSRGVKGSTAEHLEVLEYKVQQDEKRLKEVEKNLDEKREIHTNARATIKEINSIGRQSLLGGYSLTTDEFKRLVELAKKSVDFDKMSDKYKRKLAEKEKHIKYLCGRIDDLQRGKETIPNKNEVYKRNYDELYAVVKPFLEGIHNYPNLLLEVIQNRQKTNKREEIR